MIHSFSFSNYRSYFDLANLDFEAKNLSEFKESLITGIDGTELLPVCAIYGPNGGGKSSVLLALRSLANRVIFPMIQIKMMRMNDSIENDNPFTAMNAAMDKEVNSYYKWNELGKSTPTSFSIVFSYDDKMYNYNLAYNQTEVVNEELYVALSGSDDAIEVFSRSKEHGIEVCEELSGMDLAISNTIPLLSYISALRDYDMVDDAFDFFFGIRFVDYDVARREKNISFTYIEDNKDKFIEVLSSLGSNISDFRVVRDSDNRITDVYSIRTTDNGKKYEINFNEESSGTVKLLSVLSMILSSISDRSILFVIDELDAKLHPRLLQKIIEIFTDNRINISGSQLLFTSHDLTTMSNTIFRRDEIWFAAINHENQSALYSLAELRDEKGDIPRKDEVYSRRYLQGRYGADPYLRKINLWGEVCNVE